MFVCLKPAANPRQMYVLSPIRNSRPGYNSVGFYGLRDPRYIMNMNVLHTPQKLNVLRLTSPCAKSLVIIWKTYMRAHKWCSKFKRWSNILQLIPGTNSYKNNLYSSKSQIQTGRPLKCHIASWHYEKTRCYWNSKKADLYTPELIIIIIITIKTL